MKLVLFDFDGTLTTQDTTLLLGQHLAGDTARQSKFLQLGLALVLARFHLLSNTGLKKIFARLLLRGKSASAIRELALGFYRSRLDALIEPSVVNLLRSHVTNGDRVYLVSANFDCLLEPLVDLWSVKGVIASHAEIANGIFSGRLVDKACHGNEKLDRVLARFGAAEVQSAIAYGDHDDLPLLGRVEQGFLIDRARPAGLFGRTRRFLRMLAGKPATNLKLPACIITRVT